MDEYIDLLNPEARALFDEFLPMVKEAMEDEIDSFFEGLTDRGLTDDVALEMMRHILIAIFAEHDVKLKEG
ncbi:MAG: hypothetical protein ACREBC_32020 [Pyrinomonadaceae bacterium]